MRISRALLAGIVSGFFVATAYAAEPVSLGKVQWSGCQTVKLFERCEITAEITGKIHNPFDPKEITLEGVFNPPQGQPVAVAGFYYQSYEETEGVVKPSGQGVWKVRFTPRATGRWACRLRLTTSAGTQTGADTQFLVVESARPGFLRLNKEQGAFQFDRGALFLPIGQNLCWGPGTQPLAAYDQWMGELSRQKANFIRVWMAPWGFRLETKETGVGRYDQLRAWQLDKLFERSQELGIYVQLCLLNHGSFSRSQDPDWQNNPYNRQLGGMCKIPNEFATNPQAKAMFQRLLRYMVSRWGYSPNLAVWELFNEGDFGEFRIDDLNAWTIQMSQFLRSIDIIQRPITTSFHHEVPDAVWKAPTIDTVQVHVYDNRSFPALFAGGLIKDLKQKYHKPVFIGEFGWIDDFVRKFDDIGIHMHEGLWASLVGGATGSAMIWYWDSYVSPNKLERHYRALQDFWRGEPPASNMVPVGLLFSDNDLVGWGGKNGNRIVGWIKNKNHGVDQYLAYRCELAKSRLTRQRGGSVQRVVYPARTIQGATMTLKGLGRFNRYRVEWWDPYRGRIIARGLSRSSSGEVVVDVPKVQYDLAVKLIPLQWYERG